MILIAPNAFKESLSAHLAAEAIHNGFLKELPKENYQLIPLADGGNGTLECLLQNHLITIKNCTVTGPLNKKINTRYGILEDKTVVIEIALVCGLHLIPKTKRNPLSTTTAGIGDIIKKTLDDGYRRFIIALGGSGTCDVGIGLLSALGALFKNVNGETLVPIASNLKDIHHIDTSAMDKRLSECEFIVAHDVQNALVGSEGALMYAPQKGATPEQMSILEAGIASFATVLDAYAANKNEKDPISKIKGGGAAGGIGALLLATLPTKLVLGAEMMMKLIHLDEKIREAKLVITGEGQMDAQSTFGKAPVALAKLAKKHKIPVIGLAGRLAPGSEKLYSLGFTALFSIVNGPMTEKSSRKNAHHLLESEALNVAKLYSCGKMNV